jgi:hypothetical protein
MMEGAADTVTGRRQSTVRMAAVSNFEASLNASVSTYMEATRKASGDVLRCVEDALDNLAVRALCGRRPPLSQCVAKPSPLPLPNLLRAPCPLCSLTRPIRRGREWLLPPPPLPLWSVL